MNLESLQIAVLGAGRSGRAAAELAAAQGARVTLLDTAPEIERPPAGVAECVAGGRAHDHAGHWDLLVTSPGISLESGWGAAMAGRASRAVGETELASWFFRGRVIGITGTNGKTTTTELAAGMLAAAGMRAVPAGNHGVPLSEVVLRQPEVEMVALELSSFQLETIDLFRPEVGVWLNFAADHLDRYPDVAAYRAAKERLFLNMGPSETAVVPPAEVEVAAARGGRLVTFGLDDGDADYHLRDGRLMAMGVPVIEAAAVALRGRHNLANLLAAIAAVTAAGADVGRIGKFLAGYRPPAHRYEPVRRLGGVDWINDSKATNLDALRAALEAEERTGVLLAGGKDKHLDLSPLAATVARSCRAVIALGETAGAVERAWGGGVPVSRAASMEEAVEMAERLARPGDRVLLSPGASSFDWFRDYTERGDVFRRLVQALPESAPAS